jgi:hypothetical protein
VLMENKGEILYRNTGKRNCKIWCAHTGSESRDPVTRQRD